MSEQEEKKSWGGVREGAGREPDGDKPRKVQVTFRVTEDLVEALDSRAEEMSLSRNQCARELVRAALDEDP